jgi:DNA-binding transcriptional regulator YhcF (GntR family)
MTERGVFAVDRGLFGHEAFADEPFTEREAFLWLVSEAAWKDRARRIGTHRVVLERGQLAASLRYLAGVWQWHESKVNRFLTKLRSECMIETDAKQGINVITICNYDKYQRVGLPVETETETPIGTGPKQDRNNTETLKHLITETRALTLHEKFLEAARADVDWSMFNGVVHQLDAMLARGFSEATILAGAARAMIGKNKPPNWPYFAKCIETENDERSTPAKPELKNATDRSVHAAADRLVDKLRSFDRPAPTESGVRIGASAPPLRAISNG